MPMVRAPFSKTIQGKQELLPIVEELIRFLPGRLIVLLAGEPGAGKTEFVRAFVQSLTKGSSVDVIASTEDETNAGQRLDVAVTSPTFALHQCYEVNADSLMEVDHWDLYRLESEDDLESSGFWDQFSKPQLLVFIEWPERVLTSWLPQNIETWSLQIEKLEGDKRRLNVSFSKI